MLIELFRRKSCLYALLFLLVIQAGFSLLRLDMPFVDGRLHWNFDNANFLLKAIHSRYWKADPELTRFGTAQVIYDESGGTPIGVTRYTHHPVLAPFLFQWHVAVFGSEEWVPRSFSLMLSLLSTAVLFLILLKGLGGRIWMSLGFSLLYVFLPLKFTFMDQWRYEHIGELLVLSIIYALIWCRDWHHRYLEWGLCGLLFVLAQTDYLAYFMVPVCLVWIFTHPSVFSKRFFWSCLGVFVFGSFMSMIWQFGGAGFFEHLMHAFRQGTVGQSAHVSLTAWTGKQVMYLVRNLGHVNVFFLALFGLLVMKRRLWRDNELIFFGLGMVLSNIVYMVVFRHQAFNHLYIQWHFLAGYVLLSAGFLSTFNDAIQTDWGRRIGLDAAVLLLGFSIFGSLLTLHSIWKSSYGTDKDMSFIRESSHQIVYVSDGFSGPEGWWDGPVVRLYTDPIYSNGDTVNPRLLSQVSPEGDSDRLLVLAKAVSVPTFLKSQTANERPVVWMKPAFETPTFRYYRYRR